MEIECVEVRHFEEALGKTRMGITGKMKKFYEEWEVAGMKKL